MGPANIRRVCKPANNLKVQIKPTVVYLSNQNDENKRKTNLCNWRWCEEASTIMQFFLNCGEGPFFPSLFLTDTFVKYSKNKWPGKLKIDKIKSQTYFYKMFIRYKITASNFLQSF